MFDGMPCRKFNKNNGLPGCKSILTIVRAHPRSRIKAPKPVSKPREENASSGRFLHLIWCHGRTRTNNSKG